MEWPLKLQDWSSLNQVRTKFPNKSINQTARTLAELRGKFLGAVWLCAPGRAHSLGGESPLLARQGEELAERQGCRG